MEETVIMEGLCNRVKSEQYVQNGTAILTNRRFIYQERSFIKKIQGFFRHTRPLLDEVDKYGAATPFLDDLDSLTSEDMDFAILLSDIESIADGKQGVSKTIIIKTKSGKVLNFYFTKREQWKSSIQNAVNAIIINE